VSRAAATGADAARPARAPHAAAVSVAMPQTGEAAAFTARSG